MSKLGKNHEQCDGEDTKKKTTFFKFHSILIFHPEPDRPFCSPASAWLPPTASCPVRVQCPFHCTRIPFFTSVIDRETETQTHFRVAINWCRDLWRGIAIYFCPVRLPLVFQS